MRLYCQHCTNQFPQACTCGDPQTLGRLKWGENGDLMVGGVVVDKPEAGAVPGDEFRWLAVGPMEYAAAALLWRTSP